MTKLLRTDLPEFIWEGLNNMARADGKTIGVYAKRVLIAHVEAAVPVAPEPTATEWLALKGWVAETPEIKDQINAIKGRAEKLSWARVNGFPV